MQSFAGQDRTMPVTSSYDCEDEDDPYNPNVINCIDNFILHDGELSLELKDKLCKGMQVRLIDMDKEYEEYNQQQKNCPPASKTATTTSQSKEKTWDAFEMLTKNSFSSSDEEVDDEDDMDEEEVAQQQASPRRLPQTLHSPMRTPSNKENAKKVKTNSQLPHPDIDEVEMLNETIGSPDFPFHAAGQQGEVNCTGPPNCNTDLDVRPELKEFGYDVDVKNENGSIDQELFGLKYNRLDIDDNASWTSNSTRRKGGGPSHGRTGRDRVSTAPAASSNLTSRPRTAASSTPVSTAPAASTNRTSRPTGTGARTSSTSTPLLPANHAAHHAARVERLQQNSPCIQHLVDNLTDEQASFQIKNFVLNKTLCQNVSDTPLLGQVKKFSDGEFKTITGANGIMRSAIPLFRKEETRRPSTARKPQSKPVELVCRYGCKAEGCKKQLWLGRVDGAILVYEKVDENGMVIGHDKHCHDKFPLEVSNRHKDDLDSGKDTRTDEYSLSIRQREYILNEVCDRNQILGNWRTIARALIADKNVRCTTEQEEEAKPAAFAERIRRFCKYDNKESAMYLHGERLCGDMSVQVLKDVLDTLKEEGSYEGEDESMKSFMNTDHFELLTSQLHVLNTDYGTSSSGGMSDFTFCHFEYSDAKEVAEKAGDSSSDSTVRGTL